jgi:hypothetical protein
MPVTTHPGDHLSTEAIAAVVVWMGRTLGNPSEISPRNQIWWWKEIGTLAALVGGVMALLGAFDLLLSLPWLARAAQPGVGASERVSPLWQLSLLVAAAIPAALYFPLVSWGARFSGQALFPQNITNQILAWAAGSGAVALAVIALRRRGNEGALLQKAVLAVLSVAVLYLAATILDLAFEADMRFWVVALKPMADHHVPVFLAYLIPFTVFFYATQRAFHASLSLRGAGALGHYAVGLAAIAGGMLTLVVGLYAHLFAVGRLPEFADALFSIVATQFVAVLAITAIVAVFTWRRTNGALAGALICGLLVTWYVVAGQATHV